MDLLRLALERSRTAREAVDVIINLLKEHEQGGDCHHDDVSAERIDVLREHSQPQTNQNTATGLFVVVSDRRRQQERVSSRNCESGLCMEANRERRRKHWQPIYDSSGAVRTLVVGRGRRFRRHRVGQTDNVGRWRM